MYKIKEFFNEPADEIVERWASLWADYQLGRYGLPPAWEQLRASFDPPVEVAELRRFYGFTLQVAGWDRPR